MDLEIPQDEELYMALKKGLVDDDMVLPDAIDLRGQSCDRQSYSPVPEKVIERVNGSTGYAAITPRDFPPPHESETKVTYFFHADDLPEQINESHAEIRVHRPFKGFNPNHKINDLVRVLLKESLARRFQIRQHPG